MVYIDEDVRDSVIPRVTRQVESYYQSFESASEVLQMKILARTLEQRLRIARMIDQKARLLPGLDTSGTLLSEDADE